MAVLSEEEDLHGIFGGDNVPEPVATFAEALEVDLAGTDMAAVVQEKRGRAGKRIAVKKIAPKPSPQAKLDLHGCTAIEAETRTESFVQTSLGRGLAAVMIVTGKGLHSEGRAVLPDVVEARMIELRERGVIQSYSWDKGRKEESGAMVIFLGE